MCSQLLHNLSNDTKPLIHDYVLVFPLDGHTRLIALNVARLTDQVHQSFNATVNFMGIIEGYGFKWISKEMLILIAKDIF